MNEQVIDRFLKLSEVLNRVSIGESLLTELVSNGMFPQPARIGVRAVRWSEREVEAWIAARLSERPDAPAFVATEIQAQAEAQAEAEDAAREQAKATPPEQGDPKPKPKRGGRAVDPHAHEG